jgi:hypothetical protein
MKKFVKAVLEDPHILKLKIYEIRNRIFIEYGWAANDGWCIFSLDLSGKNDIGIFTIFRIKIIKFMFHIFYENEEA